MPIKWSSAVVILDRLRIVLRDLFAMSTSFCMTLWLRHAVYWQLFV